jgi:peptidoglycan/LPS O-acetylase OafA/YrhL
MTSSRTLNRNDNIDLLRAVAILLVMIVHFPRLRQIFPILNPWSGVDLFFAISGYVVAKSFVPKLDLAIVAAESPKGRKDDIFRHFKAFFIRRFVRITPALLLALVFYLVVGLMTDEPTLATASHLKSELISIFTYTANIYAAYQTDTVLTWHWSLAAEEQFYFLFPFFLLLIQRARYRALTILIWLALTTFVIRPFGMAWFGNPPAAMYLPQFRNDAIGYGFLIFLLEQEGWITRFRLAMPHKNQVLNLFITITLVVIIAIIPGLVNTFSWAVPLIGIVSAALVTIALISNANLIGSDSLAKIGKWIGLRSYGLYLFHVPVVRITQHIEAKYLWTHLPASYPIHIVFVFGLLVLLVELSYRFVELPFIDLGRKWSKKIISRN